MYYHHIFDGVAKAIRFPYCSPDARLCRNARSLVSPNLKEKHINDCAFMGLCLVHCSAYLFERHTQPRRSNCQLMRKHFGVKHATMSHSTCIILHIRTRARAAVSIISSGDHVIHVLCAVCVIDTPLPTLRRCTAHTPYSVSSQIHSRDLLAPLYMMISWNNACHTVVQ